jgi:hypothetical protein
MSVTAAFALGFDPAAYCAEAAMRPDLGLLQQPEPRAVHRPSPAPGDVSPQRSSKREAVDRSRLRPTSVAEGKAY